MLSQNGLSLRPDPLQALENVLIEPVDPERVLDALDADAADDTAALDPGRLSLNAALERAGSLAVTGIQLALGPGLNPHIDLIDRRLRTHRDILLHLIAAPDQAHLLSLLFKLGGLGLGRLLPLDQRKYRIKLDIAHLTHANG